jgi:hypothetical protein
MVVGGAGSGDDAGDFAGRDPGDDADPGLVRDAGRDAGDDADRGLVRDAGCDAGRDAGCDDRPEGDEPDDGLLLIGSFFRE